MVLENYQVYALKMSPQPTKPRTVYISICVNINIYHYKYLFMSPVLFICHTSHWFLFLADLRLLLTHHLFKFTREPVLASFLMLMPAKSLNEVMTIFFSPWGEHVSVGAVCEGTCGDWWSVSGIGLQILSTLFFWNRVSFWPNAHQASKAAWTTSPRIQQSSDFIVLGL